MAASPQSALFGLRLELERREQYLELNDESEFQLVVRGASDAELLRLTIPQTFAEEIRSDRNRLELFISLDGALSIVAPDTNNDGALETIKLDDLIARDLSPDMLQDEPEAKRMLSELHARLLKSLKLVEEAIASLSKS